MEQNLGTVEPGFNEVPGDWRNWFVISGLHAICHNWAEKYGSLYPGLRYIEVR